MWRKTAAAAGLLVLFLGNWGLGAGDLSDWSQYATPKFAAPRCEMPTYKMPMLAMPKYDGPKYDMRKFTMPTSDVPNWDMPQHRMPSCDFLKYNMPNYGMPDFNISRHVIPKADLPSHVVPNEVLPTIEGPKPLAETWKSELRTVDTETSDLPKGNLRRPERPRSLLEGQDPWMDPSTWSSRQ